MIVDKYAVFRLPLAQSKVLFQESRREAIIFYQNIDFSEATKFVLSFIHSKFRETGEEYISKDQVSST